MVVKQKEHKAFVKEVETRFEILTDAIGSLQGLVYAEKVRNNHLQENIMDLRMQLAPCPPGHIVGLDGKCRPPVEIKIKGTDKVL